MNHWEDLGYNKKKIKTKDKICDICSKNSYLIKEDINDFKNTINYEDKTIFEKILIDGFIQGKVEQWKKNEKIPF